jgi:hypothetical protein
VYSGEGRRNGRREKKPKEEKGEYFFDSITESALRISSFALSGGKGSRFWW